MRLAFDTETLGLEWFNGETAFLGSLANADSQWVHRLGDEAEASDFLGRLGAADEIIAHNLSFDVHQVRATLGYDLLDSKATLHDTDLMSRVLFPEGQRKDRGGHGLKNLAEVYLRADAKHAEDHIKEMGKQIGLRTLRKAGAYHEVWRAYPEAMENYAALDARYTYDLAANFLPRFEHDYQLRDLYNLEIDVSKALIRAEQVGVRVDTDKVDELYNHYKWLEESTRKNLDKELGDCYEGEGSEEALVEGLQKLGVPLTKTTPGGQLSVARQALAPFVVEFSVVRDLLEYRRIQKFLSTYIGPMRGREVVHPSFQQAEAWTGRMSCRRPNMQNLPKRMEVEDEDLRLRSMFIPREGHSFVVADYEGVETRVLAYYMGKQWYRDYIADGYDAHAYTAATIWGGEPEDYAKGTPGRVKRDIAKHSTFAITYGAGAPKVAETINRMVPEEEQVTVAEARRITSDIKKALPGYHRLNSRIKEKIKAEGHVRTIRGRRNMVSPDKSYVGLNALIQGTAADIMKQGLVNVNDAVSSLGGRALLVVHDEVLVEVPSEHAHEAKGLVVEALEQAQALDPPLAVEAKVTDRSYANV